MLACLAAPPAHAAGTYYVDRANAGCTDSGAGSEAAPYCTISAAVAAHAGTGTTILVKPGVYPEQVTVGTSGLPSQRYVLRATAAGVVVDGADDFSDPALWVQASGNVWLAASVTWNPQQVFADGARLAASDATPASLPAGSFQWVPGVGLYVNAGAGSPAGHLARVGRREFGFVIDGRTWVTLDGFTVTRTEGSGIYLSGSYTDLTRNTVTFAHHAGIEVVAGYGMVIGSNTVSDNHGHGIELTGGASGSTVEDNESFRNADPAQGSSNGIHIDGSTANVLRRNRLHDNQGSGLHFQNGANNCVSYLNRSWNNGNHGFDHVSATGISHVCDVASGNTRDGFAVNGGSTGTRIHDSIATDNGLATGQFDMWVDETSITGFVSEYNLFWNSTGQPPIQYGADTYSSVATYIGASGQDVHTLGADPRFAAAAAGDFHLLPGSPAIDNGNSGVTNWPATDAEGNARVNDAAVPNAGSGPVTYSDRGALEFNPGDYAPVVTAAATAVGAEGSPLTLSVTASDIDGDAIGTLDATGLPAGATFTAGAGNTAGTLSWTPDYTQAGSYTVTFTAANALSGSASTVITVMNTGHHPPVVTAAAVVVGAEGSPLTVNVTASDPDGDPIGTLVATGLPAGAMFTAGPGNSAGTLSWTPSYTQAGTYYVRFTAANALSATARTLILVPNVDRAPVLVAPTTASVPEASPLVLPVHATDADGETVVLSADLSGLPLGATFTPDPGDSTATLNWAPGYGDAGSYTVAFTAANALSATASTVITVSNVDRAPNVAAPPVVSGPEAGPLIVMVHAADPDGEALDKLTATGLPDGASFTVGPGNLDGTLRWTPTYTQAGNYQVTFTATNALTGRASTVLTVSNSDRAPVLTAPAAVTGPEASALSVTVQVVDPDGRPWGTRGDLRAPSEYAEEAIASLTAEGLPPGATFTPDPENHTGTLTWTPSYTQAGSYTVTFIAANALSDTASTVLTVTDVDRAPVITAPAAVSVAETGSLSVTVQVTDPDDEAITSVTADISGLPPGATFTPGPEISTGSLTWTPGYGDAGQYAVAFTAANALTATTSTAITVTNMDRAPAVTAPTIVSAPEAQPISFTVQAADPDGEPLDSLVASDLPAGATFAAGPGNTTGTLAWDPTFAQAGVYTVTFTAANALSGSASTVITVGNVDMPPVVVVPSAVTVAEGAGLEITVRASDPDGDPVASLVADLSGMPAGAEFVADPGDSTGKLTWLPTYRDAGEYTVSFTAANALSGTAVTHITVRNTDLPPIVTAPPVAAVAEANTLSLRVHASDPDGDAIASLTADLSRLPAGNDAVFTADPGDSTGTLTWTPTYADAGTYRVTFGAANAQSGESSVEITVSNIDVAPVITAPVTVSAPEGSPLTVTVHASDPDGDAITSLVADLTNLPAGATFTVGPGDTTGTLDWTPGYDDAGIYKITFFCANALTASSSTVLTVSNLDRAPIVSAPPAASGAEADALTLLVHAADPDGQPLTSLTADLSSMPAGATFSAEPGDSTGTLSWVPGYADAGSYSVTFTAANALSGSATTAITVVNTDRAPAISAPVAAAVLETETVTVTVRANDIDGEPVSLSANLAGLPKGNDAVFTPDPGDSTGTFTWTPSYADAGSHTVTFTAANGLSASASTVITVTNVDRAPVVTAPATVSSPEASTLVVTVHAADPDGEPIETLVADLSGLPEGATFTVDPENTTGTLTWTPGYNEAGEYTVSFFGATGLLSGAAVTTIDITNLDRAPAVVAPAAASVSETGLLTVTVHAADADGDAITALSADLLGLPPGKDAVFTPNPGDSTGTLTWTPTYADSGSYSVGFTAANALSGSSNTVIHVTNLDRAPTVAAHDAAGAEGSPLTLTVHAADIDGDAITSLSAILSGLPAGNGAVFTPGPGDSTGTLTWTPSYDDAGSYNVGFIAANALSASTGATIIVSNIDRSPIVSVPAWVSVAEASPLTLLVHAADPDGQPLASLVANLSGLPAGATFTTGPGDSTGTLSWLPGYADAGSYSVTFTAANALSASATTAITVSNTDRAPIVAAPASASAAETSLLTVRVHAADPDGQPLGSLVADLSGLPGGTFTPDPGDSTGTLAWTPSYDDAGSHTVTFTASNALAGSASTVITVSNVDRAPTVVAPEAASVAEASPLSVIVHATDPDGDAIAFLNADLSALPQGNGAVFAVDPGDSTATLTWTPGYDDSGSYTITFFAANALSGTTSTTITVTNTDRAPIVSAPAAAFGAEADLLTLLVHAADPDGDPLSSLVANLSGLPAGATFTPGPGDSTGTLSWVPGYAHAGTYSVSYTAANALSGSATTAITVANTDRAPAIAAPAAASVLEARPVTVTVHANDIDGEPITSLTANLAGLPAGNNAVFTPGPGDSTGTFTWTPTYADAGSHTVTFTTANALSASASTVITVTNVDRAPILTAPPTVSSPEAATLVLTVYAADPDGQAISSLAADLSGLPAGATFTADPGKTTGTLTWTPGYTEAGTYTARFFAAAGGLLASANTAITITNTDRAPAVVAPAAASVSETGLLTVTVNTADADGDAITALSADLSGLPPGNNAVFTPGPGNSAGTLTWTPTYADSGAHTVTFTAANALSGSSSTVITVSNVDRAPTVAASDAAVAEGSPLTLTVHAADIDGDAITSLSAILSGLPAGGDAVFTRGPGDSTGTLTWTPSYADAGSYTVGFIAANALSGSAGATITVSNTDRSPIVSAPAAVFGAEADLLTLLVHAADPDGQPLSSLVANLSGLPAGATFTPGPGDSTGTLSWVPGYAHAGSYSVTFTAANALSGSATTAITVSNTDRAPSIAAPAAASVLEAKPVTVTVHANDIDGEPITSLTANLAGLPAGNNAVFTPGPGDSTGTFTWTPTYADAGSYSVTFTAANALSASASTVITVTNVDRAPVVTAPATVSSPEATTLVLTVSAADPDGQAISSLLADLSGLPAGATFTVAPGNATGTLTWTPGYAQAGVYSVTFFAAAGGLSNTASTAITITNSDRAPVVAAPAAASVSETSALTVTVHAADADGQSITALSANLSALPAGNNAIFSHGPGDSTGTLTWTPTYADSGSYTVTFTAANALSGSASTVFHVTNLDRAPSVSAPAASVAEGSPLTLTVHAADIDGDGITTLSANLSGLPAGNNAVFTPGPGDSTGALTWTPTYGDAGSYSVTFTAANALSAWNSSTITVTNTDRAPVVSVPAIVPAAEAAPLTLTVHAADLDGQPLASLVANLSGLPAGHNAAFAPGPGDSTGTLTWTPTYADSGSYAVTFTAANALSGSAVAVIRVANTDRAPAVSAPAAATVAEASPVSITVHAADIDHDAIASLTANLSGLPAGHNAVFTPGPGDSTGTFTWTPTYADAGSYTVTFTTANALSGSASTVITVSNVDRAPVVTAPAAVSSPEGTTLVVTVNVADPDGQAINSLLADLSGLPAGATFTPGPGRTTGTLTWTPGYFHAGSYSVTFFAAAGSLSNTAITAITITNVDRAPAVAAPAAVSVSETGLLTVTVHAADPDLQPLSSLAANLTSLPAGHNAIFTAAPGDSTGTLTWTPTYADAGTYPVTFTAANALSGSAITVITVTNLDRAPAIAAPAAATVAEVSPVSVTVHAADIDGDALTLSANLSGLPAGHNAVFTPGPGDTTGTLTWTPSYAHAGSYSVTFTAANALSASVSTVITVTNVDRVPIVSVPAAVSTPEATALSLTVHAADPDGQPLASLTADLSGLPAGATFAAGPGDTTGTLSWTPGYGDAGSYSVTFFAAAGGLSNTATTVITVSNTDRAPAIAAPAATSVAEVSPVTVTVHAADLDGDALTLSANLASLPPGNNAVFTPGPGDSTGTLTWTPSYADAGSYSVTFTAANALSASASTVITVTNVDRAPIVSVPAAVSTPEATALALTVHAADPDGQPLASLTADLSGLPAGATFSPGPGDTTGTLNWTPGYGDAGSYSVTFTAANALSASASTVITVTNVDRAPTVSAPVSVVTGESDALSVTVHAADPDGQPVTSLIANLSGLPAGNNAVFTAGPGDTSGTLVWTPSYSHAGSYSVTFTAANALSGSATSAIQVIDVDRPPVVAAPATALVAENGELTILVHAADLDGETITSLTAGFSPQPPGSTPVFTPGPGDTTGTLTWTPAYNDAALYTVTFTAANALSGSASTTITVTNVDRAPVVSAPAEASLQENGLLAVTVHATDPDGDAITLLAADLSQLPAVNDAFFDAAPGDTVGTLTWTPGSNDAGIYTVTFTAVNSLVGAPASIVITVTDTEPQAGPLAAKAPVTDIGGGAATPSTDPAGDRAPAVRAPAASAEEPLIDLESGSPSWKIRIGPWAGAGGSTARIEHVSLGFRGREIAASQVTSLGPGAMLEARFDRDDLRGLFAGLPRGRQSVTLTVTVTGNEGIEPFGTVVADVVGAPEPLHPIVTPNPMRTQSLISFATSRPGPLRADIFDASGRRIRRLADETSSPAGWHTLAVDGRDDGGSALPAGIYFYRIVSAGSHVTGRFAIVK